MKIPVSISHSHVEKAIERIDKQKPRYPRNRESTKYNLHYRGRRYPPKYTLSLANYEANGFELRGFTGGAQTNNFLIALNFDIRDKKTGRSISIQAEDEDDAAVYPEGRRLYALHRKLERNPKIARLVKNKRLKETGDLCCEVCKFSFCKKYGVIGVGFIEAHHTIPLSEVKGQRLTKIKDIALVCSNCHRMLHRANPILDVLGLRKRFTEPMQVHRK